MQSPFTPSYRRSQSGVALVIVLSVLLLMSGMLVAFMGRVSTERAAQRSAASTFEAKQAYESAVNLVISQIRQATQDDTGEVGWASQPGVVRTFDNNGRDLKVFKLYSHENLQVEAAAYRPGTPAESGFNPASPNQPIDSSYVNLNEPAFTPVPGNAGRVRPHYPIVDPYARKDYRSNPIGTEPTSPGRGSVEGFYCANILHPSEARDEHGNKVLDLPMRVKWLYHLKDGTVSAMNSSGTIPGANKDNPPIARVAFWTDDESAKINLNTAAENTFWDTPGVSTIQEAGRVDGDAQLVWNPNDPHALSLSASQPARDEYQRYPGHPATTNLSPALRWLFPTGWSNKQFKESLFRLLPRINGGVGTSVSGTQNSWRLYFHPTSGTRQNNVDPRVAERDRLFASVDEFWFRPDRSQLSDAGLYNVFRDPNNERAAGSARADTPVPDLQKRFGLTPAAALERMRFFLTAVSRSSDLNLYGKPRIPIWPMADQPSPVPSGTVDRRSAFDDLIAFCSIIGGKNYYFARSKSWDPYYDFETAGRARPKDTAPNGRNKKLFEYLQQLTAKNAPGTDKSFYSKYGDDRDQILVEIFDYIRSTNLIDTGNKLVSLPWPPVASTPYPFAYTPGYDNLIEGDPAKYNGSTKSNLGSGQVIPTIRRDGATVNRGFGRFLTISESGLAFFIDDGPDIAPGVFDTEKRQNASDVPIRAVLLTEMFTPSIGYPAYSEGYAYVVREDKKLPSDTPLSFVPNDPLRQPVPMKLARGDANFVEVDAWRAQNGRFFMPTRGIANHFIYDTNPKGSRTNKILADLSLIATPQRVYSNPLGDGDYSRYPFYSQKFWVSGPSATTPPETFKFTGSRIRYDIHSLEIPEAFLPPNSPPLHPKAGPLVQQVHVDFGTNKTFTVEMPARFPGVPSSWQRVGDVLKVAPGNNDWRAMAVRTVELNGTIRADIRHAMARFDVPETYYSPSGLPGVYESATRQAHNIRTGWGRPYPNGPTDKTNGTIVAGQRHRSDKIIDIPQTMVNVPAPGGGPYGDFDRGISKHTDGPFINKADEGNIRFKADDDPAGGGSVPYFRGGGGYDEVGSNFFSPNRIMPSAVMLGSLPSGVKAGRTWETLLFAPPLVPGHRGAQAPADHYLLDLFSMPVVEPYAISEPLSTAGRINLNTRLAPFGYAKESGNRSYIDRSTGLHAVLKGLYQLAVPSNASQSGHAEKPLNGATAGERYRYPIDVFGTIERSVNPRFDTGRGYYRSATEVCELDLLLDHAQVPPEAGSGLSTPNQRLGFWTANGMTGDNNRERLYAHIYPRITTKSNTYTVHAWAQSIAKNPSTPEGDWDKFDEDTDRVLGEYRGSSTIERYIDPADEALLDRDYDATGTTSSGLDAYSRFRIINHKRFIVQ